MNWALEGQSDITNITFVVIPDLSITTIYVVVFELEKELKNLTGMMLYLPNMFYILDLFILKLS